ncbi:TspO/MBR family protein [Chroococcidiopsis sp. CCMEE 29]|uniref:TspO/MBR family protein n=1 Tax=Chroococcidiopsis sp. CCMEE 29 TaxID=155894 RepID=UPI0020223405|nr:TspO/MBR family protein [Chroococcidiopsis sp. CCMEE 29]
MKARWIITAISAAIFFGGSLLTSLQDPWFQNLSRPNWLTFEFLIPVIWLVIWVCATISAILVWEKARRRDRVWLLMILYGAIALFTALYSPVVVELRSLFGGLIVGGTATLLVYILAVLVLPISQAAAWLLLPYLLWGPVGTYLTWLIIQLNPGAVGFLPQQ